MIAALPSWPESHTVTGHRAAAAWSAAMLAALQGGGAGSSTTKSYMPTHSNHRGCAASELPTSPSGMRRRTGGGDRLRVTGVTHVRVTFQMWRCAGCLVAHVLCNRDHGCLGRSSSGPSVLDLGPVPADRSRYVCSVAATYNSRGRQDSVSRGRVAVEKRLRDGQIGSPCGQSSP